MLLPGLNLGEMLKSDLNKCMNTKLALRFLFVYFYVLDNFTVFLFHVIHLFEAVQNSGPETEWKLGNI